MNILYEYVLDVLAQVGVILASNYFLCSPFGSQPIVTSKTHVNTTIILF